MRDFYTLHPAAVLIYLGSVIILSMIFQNPVFVAVSLFFSFLSCLEADREGAVTVAKFTVPFAIFITIVNPVFNKEGNTVIFSYFGRNYTLESLIYGAVLAGMFLCGINWFYCLGKYIDSEKLDYLFRGKMPNVCAVLSAVLTLFPFFTSKLREIYGACSLLERNEKNAVFTSFKCAVGYAFEHAVTMNFSMKSRGFGTGNPTRYKKYSVVSEDILLVISTVLLTVAIAVFSGSGAVNMQFVPNIVFPAETAGLTISLVCFIALCALPSVIYAFKEIKWIYLKSKI